MSGRLLLPPDPPLPSSPNQGPIAVMGPHSTVIARCRNCQAEQTVEGTLVTRNDFAACPTCGGTDFAVIVTQIPKDTHPGPKV